MNAPVTQETAATPGTSLVTRFAQRYGVEASKLMVTLKATAFRGDVTTEQMMALLIVADQYKLNPFTREIYAFPDKGGIVPVVGIDGWIRIVQEHPQFDGCAFTTDTESGDAAPAWVECTMYRKDRHWPMIVREFLVECKRNTPAWNTSPRRMLRHKTFIQTGRLAFGFTGIYDDDEAKSIIDINGAPSVAASGVADINAGIRKRAPETLDAAMDVLSTADYAAIRSAIDAATTRDQLELAQDRIRNCSPAFHAELYDLANVRLGELSGAT